MKKERFSFVKWLTTRDIEKITEKLGYEILPQKDNPDKKGILRGKDENGYHLTVYCRDLNKSEENALINSFLMGMPGFRRLATSMMAMAATLAGASEDATSIWEANTIVLLRFDDFFLQETFSLKNEDKQIEIGKRLTKEYQNYMTKKFGRHYTDMKRAYYKQLYKQHREEEAKKAETDENSNEETL